MPSRKPKVLLRTMRKKDVVAALPEEPYIPPVKTIEDRLYDIIDRISSKGYRFTDNEYGFPWIRKEDIEHRFNGIFVIRFRCPVGFEKYGFPQVAEEVQCEIGAKGDYVIEKRKEYGIPFIEGAWALQAAEGSPFHEKRTEARTESDGSPGELDGEDNSSGIEESGTDLISCDDADEAMRLAEENFA